MFPPNGKLRYPREDKTTTTILLQVKTLPNFFPRFFVGIKVDPIVGALFSFILELYQKPLNVITG